MLYLMDLINCPGHGAVEIGINVVQIVYEADLVSVPSKERDKLFLVHAAEDGTLANFEAI